MKSQHKDNGDKLRSVVDAIQIEKGSNIVISGHGNTLSYDIKNKTGIVDIDETDAIDDRNETGIVVIERKNGKYIARHKFYSIEFKSITMARTKQTAFKSSNGKALPAPFGLTKKHNAPMWPSSTASAN